jgi:predicted ATPase
MAIYLRNSIEDSERLLSISLAGFQVFDEITEIPFGPITLLFGPNSAGKSAIEDALAILRDIWCRDENDNDYDFSKRGQLLKRHWRHVAKEGSFVGPRVVLGAKMDVPIRKFLMHLEHYAAPGEYSYFPEPTDTRGELELRLTYITTYLSPSIPDMDVSAYVDRNLEVLLDGRSLISFIDGVSCSVAPNHPSLPGWKAPNIAIDEIPSRIGKDGRIRVGDAGWTIHRSRLRLTREHFFDLEVARSGTTRRGKDGSQFFSAFKRVFDSVVTACKLTAMGAFRLEVVPASRKIPSRTDLLHFFMGPTQVIHWNEPSALGGPPVAPAYDTTVADVKEAYGIQELGDPIYRELAKSMGLKLLLAKFLNKSERLEGWSELDIERDRRFQGIGEQVNRMLTDYLFRERGYRLAADYRFLLSQKELDAMIGGAEIDEYSITYHPILVRLFLVDANGQRYAFDQVGSGLGYVLPVLATLFCVGHGILIQQPELHLHPALQAELGDILLEARDGKTGPIIVETHSEHLLLRILKRIRRTHLNQQIEPELQVRAKDISVLYFDPTINGITRVKQLRISQDGEFMDRWPKGFFPERDNELFDE